MIRKGQARWVSDADVRQQNSSSTDCSIWLPETSPPSSSRRIYRHRFQSCNTSRVREMRSVSAEGGQVGMKCGSITIARPKST